MKAIKQIVRQPLKSIVGIIMAALAVAILVTCAGQYAATALTRANLDQRYDTVAAISNEYFWELVKKGSASEDIRLWIRDTVENRPDLVKTESFTGLFSAYAPKLNADNFSRYEDGEVLTEGSYADVEQAAYRGAVLEVTLTGVGTVLAEDVSTFTNGDGESHVMLNHTRMLCRGTVDRVISMEQGFLPPVGKDIALLVTAYSQKELDALELREGGRYLVYGMDYSDLHGYELGNVILDNLDAIQELYGTIWKPLWRELAGRIDCYMTVCDYSALPSNYVSDGEFITLTDQRKYYTRDGDRVFMDLIPAEEYIRNYRIPTIARLEGTAEDFLESEEGALWRATLEQLKISYHGFPVLAVDKLGYQLAFAREQARIVEGRDFSESERANGDRVCILSEAVAAASGLTVGDTVELQAYGEDLNLDIQRNALLDTSTHFPDAAVYSGTMGFISDMERFTIVGLYRQNNAWQNKWDPYGITPNAIFIPKAAVPSMTEEMRTGESGVFYTMVLQNGKMDEFNKYQADAGYPDLYVCMDQGYGEIVAALDAYRGTSARALGIGMAGCAVILALFLALFPLQQGKTLAIMSSLGVPRGRRIRHVVVSALCLLVPGAVLGAAAGALLWERVAAALMKSVNVNIPMEARMGALAPGLALAVTAVMTAAVLLTAVVMSGGKGLGRRK